MDKKNAVEVRDVSKSFKIKTTDGSGLNRTPPFNTVKAGENIVLDRISFNVQRGEVVGIIGRNGSGKSTLLKIISNIIEPDSGTVEINGKVASILELGMGFHPEMTGRENIYIKTAMYGFSRKEIEEKINDIVEYSDLGDYIDNPLRTYSSGMGARLAFAIMIHVNADIFLVDEILSVGDVSFSAKAAQHFKSIAKSGKTVLLVSHNLGTMEEMCNRTIWIEDGKIREDGPTKLVCELYRREMIESFDITSKAAESGNVEAQYRLARMYMDGSKVGKDEAAACEWMRRAAEGRNRQAQVEYADMLFNGIGTEQDAATAIFHYQMAADGGNIDARMKLSTLIADENNDRMEIRKLFKELANRGTSLNEYRYADFLLKTAWSEDDRKEALEWFLKSAAKGNINSKFQAAVMYRDGIGTQMNIEESVKLFREAADSGHILAQVALAELLLKGIKTKKDESESFKWYLRSAESGNPKSQYQVAVMYRDGIGTDIDPVMSKKWFDVFSRSSFVNYQIVMANVLKNQKLDTECDYVDMLTKAAETGNSRAMFLLGVAYKDMTPPDMDSAIKWLVSSAERNYPMAQLVLGGIYYKGMGVEKDPQKAVRYYMDASLNGKSMASYRIATMYKDGLGVEKNDKKYREFLRIAAEGGNLHAIRESKNLN